MTLFPRRKRTTLSFNNTVHSRAITHKISDLGELKGKDQLDVDLFDPKASLIGKQWHLVMPNVIMCYVLVQCLISTQSNPYCDVSSPYADYTYQVAIAFVSCYAMAFLSFVVSAVYVHTFTEMESAHLRGIYMGAATVLLVAGCATGLYLTNVGNYACQDALGVYSPTAQWAEWLIASPLLSYLTISIEEKPTHLTTADKCSIFSIFMCILFGFMMNFTSERTSGIVLYILSAICMLGNVYLARYSNGKHRLSAHKVVDDSEPIPLWEQERATTKNKLAKCLVFGYPAFPILYLLNYFGILSTDGLVVGYMAAGFVIKFVFVSALSLEATMLQMAAERRLNESRRQLINYIFHEVRVPLNTLTMGISVLKSDRALNRRTDKGVIEMMEGSADAVTNALNDVLSMSKTEEGAMRLDLRLMSVRTLVELSVQAVQEEADRKKVSIIVVGLPQQPTSSLAIPTSQKATSPASTPASATGLHPSEDETQYMIRGDAMRLKHVLVHFLSNAIQQTIHPSRPQDAPPIVKIKICHSSLENPSCYCGEDRPPLHEKGLKAHAEPLPRFNSSCLGTVQEIHTPVPLFPSVSILVSDNHCHHKGRERCVDEQLGLVVSNQIIKLHGGELIIKPRDKTLDSVFGFLLPLLTEPNGSSSFSSSSKLSLQSRRSPSRSPRDGGIDRTLGSSPQALAPGNRTMMMSPSVMSIKSSVDSMRQSVNKGGYLTATGGMDYATSMGLPMGLSEDGLSSFSPASTHMPRLTQLLERQLTNISPSPPTITPTGAQWPFCEQTWPPRTRTDSFSKHRNFMQRNILAQGLNNDRSYGIHTSHGIRKRATHYPVNYLTHPGITGSMQNRNFATKRIKHLRHVGSMLPHVESAGDEDDDNEKEDVVDAAAAVTS